MNQLEINMGRSDNYGEVVCCECGQSLIGKARVYYTNRVFCINCSCRVNKDEEVTKHRED